MTADGGELGWGLGKRHGEKKVTKGDVCASVLSGQLDRLDPRTEAGKRREQV